MTGLGRIHRPDPRDRGYLFERLLPEVAPTGAKLYDVPIVYDQGPSPRCVGYSAAGFLTARRWAEYSNDAARFDADALYAWANTHDGDTSPHDGSTVRAGFQAMVDDGGIVVASTDQTDDPTGAQDKLASYLWADMAAANHDIDRIATWLLTVGPVVVGIPWYDSMFTPDANGVISPRGNLAGGHAILIRGYNSAREAFVFRNSWGPWGVTVRDDWTVDPTPGGDALISRHDMIRLLSEDGEAGAAVPDVIPAPTPPAPDPVPQPIPDPTPVPVPPDPTPTPNPPAPPTVTAEQIKADVQATLAAVVKLGDDLASFFGTIGP